MLRLKALGPNGVDLPLPAWTDDHATFLTWALCPDEQVSDLCQRFCPVKSNREHWQAFVDHWNKGGDERFQVLLWATPTPTGYAIGWGKDRILIHARHRYGPHMVFSSWQDNQWHTSMGRMIQEIPSVLLKLLGMKTENGDEGALFETRGSNAMIFEDAPWSAERLFSFNGCVYRIPENLDEHRRINAGIKRDQRPAFYKWLSHRLRDMARSIEEFHSVWLAGRTNSQQRRMHISQFFSLWNTIQCNPDIQKTPLLLMAYAAQGDALPGVVRTTTINTKSFSKFFEIPRWAEISETYYWDKREPYEVLLQSTPVHNHLREASRRLSLKESFRWVNAILHSKNLTTPPQALLELLLTHARRIPRESTLTNMLSSPFPFWSWLAFHTPWTKENHSEAWPNIQTLKKGCSERYKNFLRTVEHVWGQYKGNPVHFQTMARAALAWVNSSETENGPEKENPNEVLAQLQKMTIPDALRKERINKRLTWQGVLFLKHSVEAVKLSPTRDFTQLARSQDPTDAAWSTAIGNLRLGGIDVHPLCRPSHLELMGEFLQNCVQKNQNLNGYVQKAQQGHSRFFRLADKHREFLLQISHAGNQTWQVAQLKGRENHDPTPEAAAVGQRVAELYTLLSAESPTHPLPSPPNPWEASTDARNASAFAVMEDARLQNAEDRTNDLDDVVHIIREIIGDLDDMEDVNDRI